MKWIPLDEQLPKHQQYVLVNVERKKVSDRVFLACYDEFHNFFVIGHRNHEKRVSHWMPLPDPVNKKIETTENKIDPDNGKRGEFWDLY